MKHYKRHYITHYKTLNEQSIKTGELIHKLSTNDAPHKTKEQ